MWQFSTLCPQKIPAHVRTNNYPITTFGSRLRYTFCFMSIVNQVTSFGFARLFTHKFPVRVMGFNSQITLSSSRLEFNGFFPGEIDLICNDLLKNILLLLFKDYIQK